MMRNRILLIGFTVFGISAALGTIAWHKLLEERFFPKRWRAIIPGRLYASGQISQELIESTLRDHGIRVVVDLTGFDPRDPHQQAELDACRHLGIAQHRFPLAGDGQGDIEAYADAVETIHESTSKGDPVLVHCYAGLQRTNGVLAVYRVLICQDRPGDVLDAMLQSGWDANDNPKLIPFLNENMKRFAESLLSRRVISSIPEPLPEL